MQIVPQEQVNDGQLRLGGVLQRCRAVSGKQRATNGGVTVATQQLVGAAVVKVGLGCNGIQCGVHKRLELVHQGSSRSGCVLVSFVVQQTNDGEQMQKSLQLSRVHTRSIILLLEQGKAVRIGSGIHGHQLTIILRQYIGKRCILRVGQLLMNQCFQLSGRHTGPLTVKPV